MSEAIEIQLADPNWKASVDVRSLRRIGGGGLANVYRYDRTSAEAYALKFYHAPQQAEWKRIDFLTREFGSRAKLGGGIARIAWPIGRIAKAGAPVGIVLPLFEAAKHKELDCWIEPPLQKNLKPEQDALSSRLAIIKNLASTLAELHDQGIAVVDLKPSNILVGDDLSIVMLDTDSFGVRHSNGTQFPPTHISPSYIAPEAYTDHIDVAALWHEQDNYAFAVIAFQILNYGVHPFQCLLSQEITGADTNDDKAKRGLYAYGLAPHQTALPVRASVHTAWLSSLRLLFDRAFAQRADRPAPAEWRNAIGAILEARQLIRCDAYPRDVRHVRFEGMPCMRCMRDTANAEIIARTNERGGSAKRSVSGAGAKSTGYQHQPTPPDQGGNSGMKNLLAALAGIVIVLVIIKNSNSPAVHGSPPGATAPNSPHQISSPPTPTLQSGGGGAFQRPPPQSTSNFDFDGTPFDLQQYQSWLSLRVVGSDGSSTCLVVQEVSAGGRVVGMSYARAAREWYVFIEDRVPAPEQITVQVDRSFSRTLAIARRGRTSEQTHIGFYPASSALADAFANGSTMSLAGSNVSLRGSLEAYRAFWRCTTR